MFNDDSASIAGGLDRGEKDEQPMVAIFPVAGLAALATGDFADLRGSGFARHPHIFKRQAAGNGGSGAIDHKVHAVTHHGQMRLWNGQGLHWLLLPLDQIGLDLLARGDAGGQHRELQRAHLHIALANGCVECIRLRPFLVELTLLPRAVGDGAITLRRHRQIKFFAHAQQPGDRRNAIIADPPSHRIEIGVAAFHQGIAHVHRAMATKAAEGPPAQRIAAIADDNLFRVNAMLQQSQRCGGLDRGSGRIQALHRLVEHRDVIILLQHFPFQTANPVRKAVGIKGGHRGQRQNAPGLRVDDNGRTRFQPQASSGKVLQPGINGQAHGFAGSIGPCRQIPHQLAPRRDFGPLGAGRATQQVFLRFFKARFANFKARRDQQWIPIILIILGRGGPDIADQMRNAGAFGIETGEIFAWGDARHIRRAQADRGECFPVDIFSDRNRLKTGGFFQIRLHAFNILWG